MTFLGKLKEGTKTDHIPNKKLLQELCVVNTIHKTLKYCGKWKEHAQ
jgi:hypothetical protein